MNNTAARVIITVMSLLTIAAIVAGLFIHVFGGGRFIRSAETVSEGEAYDRAYGIGNLFKRSEMISDSVAFDEKVDEIYIEVDAADITVEDGDRFSVEYKLPDAMKPVVEVKKGKLSFVSMMTITKCTSMRLKDMKYKGLLIQIGNSK